MYRIGKDFFSCSSLDEELVIPDLCTETGIAHIVRNLILLGAMTLLRGCA